MRVYMDGVFDLFHRGHLEAIKKVRNDAGIDGTVIIGVVSDMDANSYKRWPIIKEDDRVEIISNIKDVDEVIFPCPMSVTKEFIDKHQIDLVVHGFLNKEDEKNQEELFRYVREINKFKTIEYCDKIIKIDKGTIVNY